MQSITILDIGFIFAFMFITLLFLSEYFSYSKGKFFLSLDLNAIKNLAILFGIIFIILAILHISLAFA